MSSRERIKTLYQRAS
jgi:hypothetical protein